MPSLKHVKRRIASVRSTKQITKAMDLVAASKLARTKALLSSARGLYKGADAMITDAASFPEAGGSVYAAKKPAAEAAYIVIASDRGLCGAYNSSVGKLAIAHMEEHGKQEQVIALGARGASFLSRRGKNVLSGQESAGTPSYEQARRIARRIIEGYKSGEFGEVYVVYTRFLTTVSHQPEVIKLLPIETAPDNAPLRSPVGEISYDPDPAAFLDDAVPVYLEMMIYGTAVESGVCEQAARMMSMNSATKNAQDIIETLTLSYNRSRQSIITQEINEIVSGANALK